ncbi:hypothetical protein [Herbidospora cretacea]|uniref:hypothetical protein n=1 Tax=Herbidospora cretacea TaxID=28444 RepID=UPI00077405EC|nr:hypothetical protein [Herbidospora cretacea]
MRILLATLALAGTLNGAALVERPPLVQNLWPQAVHVIPAVSADGRAVTPRLLLDDDTLLATVAKGFERAEALVTYKMSSGETTELADLPLPPRTVVHPSGVAAGAGHIAWWTARRDGTGRVGEIWSVPLTGGDPVAIAAFALTGTVTGLELTAQGVVWSTDTGGVWRVPYAGGRPEAVPGTTGQHVLKWPWVGSPAREFTTAVNVETGERRATRAGALCGVTLCVGPDRLASARSGAGLRATKLTDPPVSRPARDRFVTSSTMAGPGEIWAGLYDLMSGQVADLGVKPLPAKGVQAGGIAIPVPASDDRLLSFQQDGRLVIIDLARAGS